MSSARSSGIVLALGVAVASCGKTGDDKPQSPSSDGAGATQELVRSYQRCWSQFNTGSWELYRTCFASDVRFEAPGIESVRDIDSTIADAKRDRERADIELVFGADMTVIGLVRLDGPGGKRDVVEIVDYDERGRIRRDRRYFDASIARSRSLPIVRAAAGKRVVIGTGSPSEHRNGAALERLVDAWGHPAMADLLAADLSWSEPWFEGDLDKQGVIGHMTSLARGIDPFELGGHTIWLAGDFVVLQGTLEGNVRTAVPSVAIDTVDRHALGRFDVPFAAVFAFADGKVTAASLFWQTASFYKQLGIEPRTAPLAIVKSL